ncbi:MAG TPA: hypothetical protein VGT82_03405 [Ktedonobacteraceae bacterium]|nr:hypothetical protein [Ktedonobacteraceae bacterium]
MTETVSSHYAVFYGLIIYPVGMGLASIRPGSRVVGKRMEASPIPTG